MAQRGLDHQRMRRADRGDAGALAGAAPARQRSPDAARRVTRRSRAAMKASTSASGRDALHRPLAGDGERAAGIGDAQRLARAPRRAASGSRRQRRSSRRRRSDRPRRRRSRATAVRPERSIMHGAVLPLLDDDSADAAGEQFGDRLRLVLGLGEQEELVAARQEEVGCGPARSRALRAGPAARIISLRMFGSNETVPPLALTASIAASATAIARSENSDEPMTWTWSAPASSFARPPRSIAIRPAALCLMLKTKCRLPSAAVGDEGAARRLPRVNRDRRHVGARAPAADRCSACRNRRRRRRRSGRPAGRARAAWPMKIAGAPDGKGPTQRPGLQKALADPLGHDLDEDLAGADQLLHFSTLPTPPPASRRIAPAHRLICVRNNFSHASFACANVRVN